MESNPALVNKRALEIGEGIFANSSKFYPKMFRKGYLNDMMMQWSMRNPGFKVEMFRFVDVLPTLADSKQVIQHIREYLIDSKAEFPFFVRPGLKLATGIPFTKNLTTSIVRKNVSSMARSFISGQNAKGASGNLRDIWDRGLCFTVDILGEAVVSEEEAHDYQNRYLDLVENLGHEVQGWPKDEVLEGSPHGLVPRANVSVKCTSLYSQIDVINAENSTRILKERLRPILRAAIKNGVFINLDMEQYAIKNLFLDLALEIFAEDEFKNYPHFGIVIQAYLKDSYADVERVVDYCKTRKTPVTVRLVKGAYWDYEVINAKQQGWPVPVYEVKAETDANYERCMRLLLDSYPHIHAAFGSHNIRSLSFAMAYAENLGLAKTAFEVQMLYGMADAFKGVIKAQGYRIREYAPVGEILPGMAYLVRRLLENSSNEGFLQVKFLNPKEAQKFLQPPFVGKDQHMKSNLAEKHEALITIDKPMPQSFQNEPLRDFSKPENRKWIESTLKKIRSELPVRVHPIVNGEVMEGSGKSTWYNPSLRTELVTEFSMANQVHADKALAACEKAMKTWGKWPVAKRCQTIRKVADVFRRHRDEITAFMVLETGKNFKEADGDIAEAIDFCDYYALQMLQLSQGFATQDLPGENNVYHYRPRGTAVAIAPWNFPLAILTGMAVGPLVCGNPVILKPAEQSTGVARFLYDALTEAGVPIEAFHLLPGAGEVVGEYLVNHSKTHIITFTGSKAVGLTILRNAYQPLPGQKHIKKVVAELGGKNGLIVDEDADLDEAVVGALHSAFGFQGQKCSALSRIIIVESAYDKFKVRFAEAMKSLKIGTADDVSAKVGPLIDSESQKRIFEVIERHKNKVVAQLPVPAHLQDQGNFVPPTVFEETDFKSELAQKEFFAPLVTLFKVKTFDEAIEVLNGVDYALTGGVYSRSPKNIEKAKTEIEVGNLYINRSITGALVCRQPFGGYKLSGVGGKAGGPDYLLQFLEPITVTENTMRRGFAPDL